MTYIVDVVSAYGGKQDQRGLSLAYASLLEKKLSPRTTKLTGISGFLLYIRSYKIPCTYREYCPISNRNGEGSSNEVECFHYETPQKDLQQHTREWGKHKKCIAAH